MTLQFIAYRHPDMHLVDAKKLHDVCNILRSHTRYLKGPKTEYAPRQADCLTALYHVIKQIEISCNIKAPNLMWQKDLDLIGNMPRKLESWKWKAISLSADELVPGDIIFLKGATKLNRLVTHVCMAISKSEVFHCSSEYKRAKIEAFSDIVKRYELPTRATPLRQYEDPRQYSFKIAPDPDPSSVINLTLNKVQIAATPLFSSAFSAEVGDAVTKTAFEVHHPVQPLVEGSTVDEGSKLSAHIIPSSPQREYKVAPDFSSEISSMLQRLQLASAQSLPSRQIGDEVPKKDFKVHRPLQALAREGSIGHDMQHFAHSIPSSPLLKTPIARRPADYTSSEESPWSAGSSISSSRSTSPSQSTRSSQSNSSMTSQSSSPSCSPESVVITSSKKGMSPLTLSQTQNAFRAFKSIC